MNVMELLAALANLRGDIAKDIKERKGAGSTTILGDDSDFVVAAARLGWHNGHPPTAYTLLKSIEFAHAQITIETVRDGVSETAGHMLAAIAVDGNPGLNDISSS